jgi:alkyl hydroperoxide reductase subunit AhpF
MIVPAVFSFVGAVPRTEWLPPEIEKDERGFVSTGPSLNVWSSEANLSSIQAPAASTQPRSELS